MLRTRFGVTESTVQMVCADGENEEEEEEDDTAAAAASWAGDASLSTDPNLSGVEDTYNSNSSGSGYDSAGGQLRARQRNNGIALIV